MTRKDNNTPKDPRRSSGNTQPARGKASKSDGHESDGADEKDKAKTSPSAESTSAIVRPPTRPY